MNASKTNRIILRNDNWGDAVSENILAVLTSTIELFEENIQPENFNSKLVVVQNSNDHKPPIDHPIMYKGNPENFIFLSVQDRFWANYSYQFSHEYCHHLIESDFINSNDSFGWFEESLCELASIHSIKNMAQTWKKIPPYPNWGGYSKTLDEYADEIINRETNKIEIPLSNWVEANIIQLSKDRYDREKNCLIATNIANIFFNDPSFWNSISYINKIKISEDMVFSGFIEEWGNLLPEKNIHSWNLLKNRLINKAANKA